ncbi:MAG TPA: methyl-accepting chemotaxis protein [Ruminococcaceae bacterium]|jgi:methyl-accepting chemotaxis protein|nr:methyl-accepting chemotaxis protein [Oscillospiraceae bacterium]
MKKYKTLKKKLISNSVITLVIAMAVSLLVSATLSYRGMENNVKSDMKSIGQTAQVAVNNSKKLMEEKITLVASLDEIGKANSKNDTTWIGAVEGKKLSYGYDVLYVADERGNVISSDSNYKGKNIADTEYFKSAMDSSIYLSTPMKDIAGQLEVICCAPVTNSRFQGVVVGEMDPQTYSYIVSTHVVIGKTGDVFILDKKGTMIANKRPQLVSQQQNFIEMAKKDPSYATAAAVYKNMIAGKTNAETYDYENGKRICYYQPLSGTDGWSCGTAAPVSEMMYEFYPIIIGMVIATAALIVVGVLFASKFAKGVSSPIRACSQRLLLLAKGDLHSDVPKVDTADETGDLAKATATLTQRLHAIIQDETSMLASVEAKNFDIVSESYQYLGDFKPLQTSINNIIGFLNKAFSAIDQSAAQVAGGSGQVSDAAQMLSQGATEQASSVEELSKSVENLSGEIRSNAENAVNSNKKAKEAENELLKGSQQMEKLTCAMDSIQASTQKISKIIKTVQDIASQTNILALNAAVEAARAGEAGKGFSVVADEVRRLAGKSSQANKEIAELVSEMKEAVGNGGNITGATNKTIVSIVDMTKGIITSMDEISNASQKQSESISSVTQNMNQISSVIQTNSATAEESAAASEELSSQASEMQEFVQQFRLRSGE